MDCEECQASLADYLGHALAEAERAAVQEHLLGCPACRLEAELEARLEACLADAPTSTPPAGFALRVLERARAEGLVSTRASRAPVRTASWAAWVALPGAPRRWRLLRGLAAAASLAALALGTYSAAGVLTRGLLARAPQEAGRVLAAGDAVLERLPDASALSGALSMSVHLGSPQMLAAGAVAALIAATWALYHLADDVL